MRVPPPLFQPEQVHADPLDQDAQQQRSAQHAEETKRQGDKAGEKKDAGGENKAAGAASEAVTGGLKGALAGLEDLWDENQYKEEFALDGFIKSLNKKG